MAPPLRILMTSDAAGGVGSHATQLASALRTRGHAVFLAVFDPAAAAGRDEDSAVLPYRLEWMGANSDANLAAEIRHSRWALAALSRSWQAQIVHANQFAFVACTPRLPSLLSVHSDLWSWWRGVHGHWPPGGIYHNWYRRLVAQGLQLADAVVAPTHAVLGDLRCAYGFTGGHTVPHGTAGQPAGPKASPPFAVWLGRIWDEAKQFDLLRQAELAMPVLAAGDATHPVRGPATGLPSQVRCLGHLARGQARALLADASVLISTSRYEPFGLAVLEAAHAGCALLLNDIPSFREVWGTSACYFVRDDAASLGRCLQKLAQQPDYRASLAAAAIERARRLYAPEPMAAAYERLYRGLLNQ